MIVGLFRGRCAKSINGTVQIFMNLLELLWENKLVGSLLIIVGDWGLHNACEPLHLGKMQVWPKML